VEAEQAQDCPSAVLKPATAKQTALFFAKSKHNDTVFKGKTIFSGTGTRNLS